MAPQNLFHGFPRRLPFGGWMAVVFLVLGLTAYFSLQSASPNEIATVWPCNGILTAFLLASSRRRWGFYVLCGFAGIFVAGQLHHFPLPPSIALAGINAMEAWLSAWIINPSYPGKVELTLPNHFLRFFGGAVLFAPLLAALSASAILSAYHMQLTVIMYHWFASDALGMAIVPPTIIAFYENPPAGWIHKGEFAPLFALFTAFTLAIFLKGTEPLLFIIYPLLQIICIRLGLGAATVGVFLIAIIGGSLTAHGHGPLALTPLHHPANNIFLFQLFLALALFMSYATAIVLTQRDRIAAALQKNSLLYRLVTEHSRDIIVLADLEGRFLYVSPAVTEILGYRPDELLQEKLESVTHPDDQAEYLKVLSNLRKGQDGQSFTYRDRKKSGAYVWVEGNIRLYRDNETGEPIGFLNVVRDISRRKKDEEDLQRAYRAVEALAGVDGLTGIANRRRFDEVLAQEWRRGVRDRNPLSLLLLDVDFFKSYNDHYGHVRGDSCLKQIAEAALDVVSRTSDVIARFGGEEFALILPNTTHAGAKEVAENLRAMVERRALDHTGNPYKVVTISIGCATLVPQFKIDSLQLIELADQALYTAKKSGRNCVVGCEPELEELDVKEAAVPPVSTGESI
jgi:diguanylate cyclase (GGDEF)-like protein/PAS domain S-box-containing protein